MGLIQNNHMIIKQIRIVYALPDKHTISYVSDLSLFFGVIVKSNCIPYLVAKIYSSFFAHSISHAHCCHTTRLSANNFNLGNLRDHPLLILFNIPLILNNTCPEILRICHILRELRGFTRARISGDHHEILFANEIVYFLFVLEYRQSLSKLFKLLTHDLADDSSL